MANANQYFTLARNEEQNRNRSAALLFYISSFCDSFNSGAAEYPYGTVYKIRRLQLSLGLTDEQLCDCVHSYGPLTDQECRNLLCYSICGCISGIKSVLSGSAHGY